MTIPDVGMNLDMGMGSSFAKGSGLQPVLYCLCAQCFGRERPVCPSEGISALHRFPQKPIERSHLVSHPEILPWTVVRSGKPEALQPP